MSVIRNISVVSSAFCLAVVLSMTVMASSSPSVALAARDAGNMSFCLSWKVLARNR
jgi:hypothetical protein